MKAEWKKVLDDRNLTTWRLEIKRDDRYKIVGSVYEEKWNPKVHGFTVYLAHGTITQRTYETRELAQIAVETAALTQLADEVAALVGLRAAVMDADQGKARRPKK